MGNRESRQAQVRSPSSPALAPPAHTKISFVEFRKYQCDILDDFERRRSLGERKFHYVSPPGSGKTLIGLELFLRLGEKALVLSPTLAVQDQWARMCRTWYGNTEVSFDPFSNADLVSLTYQSVSVKDEGELHKNSRAILEALQDRRTIIFDECHHLTSFWGTVLKQLDTRDRYFIGLTATAPFEKTPQELDVYEQLLDTIDYEVSLPPVIKEGYLAPYNDLVYLVSPTEAELELIRQRSRLYREIMAAITGDPSAEPGGAAGPAIESPQSWAYDRLENFTDEQGRVIPFDELYRKREQFCIALARFSQHYGLGLPYSVIFSPEMEEPPDFSDILEVMTDYGFNYLQNAGGPWFDKLYAGFREMGFELAPGGCKALPGNIRELLGNSRGKLAALGPILEGEAAFMAEELRCLILCDLETSPQGCGAMEAFRYIAAMKETVLLRPILLSGKTFLVHQAGIEDFLVSAEVFFKKEGLSLTLRPRPQESWYEVYAESLDGTGGWNTRISVPLVTSILERGLCRCLVSTRSLLGEGWNVVTLNTLIDLTAITSYAYVNQIRGRSLRLDDKHPFKTANNWDIVTVMEDPDHGLEHPAEFPAEDLERLRKKYTRFYGIGADGVIEKGIGHAHPLLARRDIKKIYRERTAFNAEMLRRAQSRLEWYKKWKIGQSYQNRSISCLEITIPEQGEKIPLLPADHFYFEMIAKMRKKSRAVEMARGILHITLAILIPGSLILCFLTLVTHFHRFKLVFLLPYLILGIVTFNHRKRKPAPPYIPNHFINHSMPVLFKKEQTHRDLLLCLSQIVLRMLNMPGGVSLIRREDGSYRLYCSEEKLSHDFARAVSDILAPLGNQKYFLLINCADTFDGNFIHAFYRQHYQIRNKQNFARFLRSINKLPYRFLKLAIPVPGLFSKTKKEAEQFCALWEEELGRAQIIGQRAAKRGEIIASLSRLRALPFRAAERELWE